MTTITLQRTKAFSENQRTLQGPVTGTVYVVNASGLVTVDTTDQPYFVAQGFIPAYGGTGGVAASGVATIDFGVFPGSPLATATVAAVDVADPSAVLDAWIAQVATVDHTADEHAADPPLVSAVADGLGNIVITGQPSGRDLIVPPGTPPGNLAGSQAPIGQTQLMPVGKWSVAWAFSP